MSLRPWPALRRALRASGLFLPVLLLAGCFGVLRTLPGEGPAPVHVTGGPAELVLVTVTQDGVGRHSALVIDDGTRVVYDPAGGWRDPDGLSNRDLRLAMTDARLDAWLAYHTRRGREVTMQRRAVPPATARAAHRIAARRGAGLSGLCSRAVATLLRALPGFTDLPPAVTPVALRSAFAGLDGVTSNVVVAGGVRARGDLATDG